MNILSLDHISKSYTGRLLFENASFYLHEGEKVGIIGINGTGKSTLLRIIAGMEEPDDGQVIRANNQTVQLLMQHPEFEKDITVLAAVLQSHVKALDGEQGHENDFIDIPALEVRAKTMLMQLGISDFDQKVEQLSGGQKKRIALVSSLLHQSDLLLLDEPTNHLDAPMAEWLEDYLKAFKGTVVMITHDRYFLDSVAGRIVEVDRGSIYSYDENYSGYLQRKAEREESMQAAERKRKSLYRTELKWVMRGAQARSTKQKARLQRFEDLKQTKLFADDGLVEMSSIKSRMGKTTIELSDLSKAYNGNVLFKDFSYTFLKNDRVGFVGRNGCGKTTLMKMIASAQDSTQISGDAKVFPDTGSIVIGQTIKIGYYSQEIAHTKAAGVGYMDPKKRVIDFVKDIAEFVPTVDGPVSAARMCERFLFDSEQQYSLIEKLSGGQKRRLHLLRILMEAPNVLILDEPTNDLDIATLTVLEDYLDSFDGILITVSHDRFFLDRCVRRIFAFEDSGHIRQYEGGYTDYQTKLAMEGRLEEMELLPKGNISKGKKNEVPSEDPGNEAKNKNRETQRAHQKKFSYKEQREYETIEDDIAGLEEEIERLESEILKASRDFVKLNELTKQKEETEELLLEKMDRWEYLEELALQISRQSK